MGTKKMLWIGPLAVLAITFFMSACGMVQVIPKSDDGKFRSQNSTSSKGRMVASISPSVLPGSSDPNATDYILGEEDHIEILVWKNEELSRTVFIRPDGKISLPLIGDVQAAGLTPNELKDSIKVLLRRFKKTPEVSVIVREINSLTVFLIGEILRPGKIQLRSETTLLQAITLAGGFSEFANRKKIVLLRKENGIDKRITINYNDILSGRNSEANVVLKRGDTILVP